MTASIAAIALEDAEVYTHHVVQRITGGGVVLPVDPVGDQHRRCHQKLQHDTKASLARCNEKCRVARKAPLRAGLRWYWFNTDAQLALICASVL